MSRLALPGHDRRAILARGPSVPPRACRVHVAGGVYHAVLRGNHRREIFAGREEYLRFEDILAAALERYGAALFAYCWMTNHVHLAVRVEEAPLGAVMGIVASRYARWRQRAVPTTGHLFERRYRARLVDADRYLLALVRYIHFNPVRSGIAVDPAAYPWSSHGAYLGESPPRWLRTDAVLGLLDVAGDPSRSAYRRFMGEEPPASEREALNLDACRSQRATPAAVPASPGARMPRSLAMITAEVASAHGVAVSELLSQKRKPPLVRARVGVAQRALREGAANLSQVARHLGRSPSTLSDLLRSGRYDGIPKP